MKLTIHCDGASRGNPGPAACAFVVYDQEHNKLKQYRHFLGFATNNQAEYAAILLAHQWLASSEAKALDVSGVKFVLDSELAVKQLKGIYKIKNTKIASLVIKIKKLQEKLNYPISFVHVKRDQNSQADKLANKALDEKMKK